MTDKITMAHGSGGTAYRDLVKEVFFPEFSNTYLNPMNDSAICPASNRIALTTDSYVVKPLFFPGGDIGRLAISGTVNDLAVSGALPRYITVGMILEVGFNISLLKQIVHSMAQTAHEAGVTIVTGDTKVVEKHACEGIFINTAGVGTFLENAIIPSQRIQPGDVIITSGFLGSHGTAIMAARGQMDFQPPILSDVSPMADAVQKVLECNAPVNAMRDPTRGGIVSTLCEWITDDIDILLEESSIPVRSDVAAACEILGLDPLYIANEGVVLFSVPSSAAELVLRTLRSFPTCQAASIIGTVCNGNGALLYHTRLGATRRLIPLYADQLPRIC